MNINYIYLQNWTANIDENTSKSLSLYHTLSCSMLARMLANSASASALSRNLESTRLACIGEQNRENYYICNLLSLVMHASNWRTCVTVVMSKYDNNVKSFSDFSWEYVMHELVQSQTRIWWRHLPLDDIRESGWSPKLPDHHGMKLVTTIPRSTPENSENMRSTSSHIPLKPLFNRSSTFFQIVDNKLPRINMCLWI